MTLLEFARGPALWASIVILVAGMLWRIAAIYRIPRKPDYSEPREHSAAGGALRLIVGRMVPHSEFGWASVVATMNGYVYHIGLAIIVFAYLPHVLFIERLTGLSWPALPAPVVYVAVAITFISLIGALIYRSTDPVRRLISSPDDYVSWVIVFLPLLTGMAALENPMEAAASGADPLYPAPLAIHLLSVELLLIWLPFGKLAHSFMVFFSRGMTGAAFARRGART